jgi:hypothetical protein
VSRRWVQRPDGSNWGDFGADDRLGRLNLIDRNKVLEGAAEIREGLTFALSLPLDYPGGSGLNPNRLPPVVRPNLRNGEVNFNVEMSQFNPDHSDVLSDDLVVLHLQYSTQWDSFAHAGQMFDANGDGVPEAVYYNGYRAGVELVGPDSLDDAGLATLHERSTSDAGPLGINNFAEKGIQGRGVLIDLEKHFGTDFKVVTGAELLQVIKADQVEIRPGDIVCLHTGYAEKVLEMERQPDADVLHHYGAVLDGRDPELLAWVTDSGLAALVADNYAVELYPASPGEAPCAILPLHEHCLFKLGIPLGELWRLGPLASWLRANDRHGFQLTAAPLNLPRACASPLTPIATV